MESVESHDLKLACDEGTVSEPPWCISQELLTMCSAGDILLVCKGNIAVQCHCQILSLCSPVLKDLFESTNIFKTCSQESPSIVPLLDDVAEHWLFALMFIYPLVHPAQSISLETAPALALLGHKYNMPKLNMHWHTFIKNDVLHADPNLGHFKWLVPNWEAKMKAWETRGGCEESESFQAGGITWTMRLGLSKSLLLDDNIQTLNRRSTLWLEMARCAPTGDPSNQPSVKATYQMAVVCPQDIASSRVIKSSAPHDFAPGQSWETLHIMGSQEQWCQEGERDKMDQFLKGNALEIHGMVCVEPETPDPQLAARTLTGYPESSGYVFKWLDLARLVADDVLKEKCITFISNHAYFALFDPVFRKDLHAAFAMLGPEDTLRLVRNMQDTV